METNRVLILWKCISRVTDAKRVCPEGKLEAPDVWSVGQILERAEIWGRRGIGTKGPEKSVTESVNEKPQVCRFFWRIVESVQTGVSCYEKKKSDMGVYKKLSTFFKGRFWAKSEFSTELSTMSTKIDSKI